MAVLTRLVGDDNGASGRIVSPFEDEPAKPQETFLDVSSVLKEAQEMGEDFVFTDDEEVEVWELEEKLAADPINLEEDLPEVQGALNPDDADVTSAYSPEQGFKEMDVDELNRCLNTNGISLLLDVRTQEEFVDGHVPGAKNVPLDELSAKVREGKLDEYKDKAIAVICQMGSRSAQATVRLSKVLLFTDVTTVKGGTNEWIARGYPVE